MEEIRLIKIIAYPINLLAISDRKYKLETPVIIDYHTSEGVIRVIAEKGFETDGRSGGPIVDLLLPNIGKAGYRNAWLFHDIAYSLTDEKGISFELANNLFRQALKLPKRFGGAGMSSVRAWLAWKGVESYFGKKAFDTSDKTDRCNKDLCSLQWRARI